MCKHRDVLSLPVLMAECLTTFMSGCHADFHCLGSLLTMPASAFSIAKELTGKRRATITVVRRFSLGGEGTSRSHRRALSQAGGSESGSPKAAASPHPFHRTSSYRKGLCGCKASWRFVAIQMALAFRVQRPQGKPFGVLALGTLYCPCPGRRRFPGSDPPPGLD